MTAWITVHRPGLLTTVQDLGRWGYQAWGVPVGGPMDAYSHRLANLLVHNPSDAAALEVTLIGPDLEFDAPSHVAICGAEFDVTLNGHPVPIATSVSVPRGGRLQFGRRHAGARAYLAVSGGIRTELVLGSRATHLVSGMGGFEGRALVSRDRLPFAASENPIGPRRAPLMTLPSAGRARVRLLPGPQADWFTSDAMATLASTSFLVSPRSNRMGYRLDGPPLTRKVEKEPISEPLTFGAIQVPAAGAPILLMADRQTAGGYPKIGVVIAADWPIAGQLAPGDFVEFAWCTRREAAAALIGRERPLLRVTNLEAGT